ncbi:MAG: flagellar hook-length control protein FliK [Lachnospiraceae bacterium]|nr:flagellar hook-length control protein FliK [Lachnospiraceae bacterium]
MGFSLSNLISYGTTTPVSDTSGVSSSVQTQLDKGMAALKSMSPGETLQGEVVSVNGNEVTLKIADNAVISAKLEQSMNVAVGQKMMFEISNNSNGQVALRALFTNLAQEQLATNALQMAGIETNGQTAQMISGLMKEGMPIDMQTLQSVYHDIIKYPETDQSLLVHMHKIGMETTPQNVEQFQALVNYEERVAGTINELIHEIPGELNNMAQNGDMAKVMAVTQELVSLISEHEAMTTPEGMQSAVLNGEASAESVNGQNVEAQNAAAGNPAEGVAVSQAGEEATVQQSAMDKALAALEEALNPQNQAHTLVDGDEALDALTVTKGEDATALNANDKILSGVLTKAEYTELANALEQNGFSKETVALVKNGNLPLNELFTALKAELVGKDAAVAGKLWDNQAFSKLMTKQLQSAWLLDPAEVENGKNVTDFYNRINQQVNSVISSMSQSLAESSVLSQSLQQFQENVDFLNNLNQFMPYVQLPLKMNGHSATGDLIVYADKKSLAAGKDTVSAALHLDMQHLGMVDVFVKMQDKNVTTDFCLENEETLNFIAEHIDMLSERLERRGYNLNTQMKVKDTKMSLKEDILPQTPGGNLSVNSQGEGATAIYRFDVRA